MRKVDWRTRPSLEEETAMRSGHEGLPAATVEQAIILAQLQILRRMEQQRNTA
jgi:hypothetical protein